VAFLDQPDLLSFQSIQEKVLETSFFDGCCLAVAINNNTNFGQPRCKEFKSLSSGGGFVFIKG